MEEFMKKKILCIVTSIVIFALSICANISVFAEDADPLIIYKSRLEELNNLYNTNMEISDTTASGGSYSEIIKVFSSMSMDEFDEYILSIIDG